MIKITANNFEEAVLRSEKPVLVEFYAPWCVYCRRIGPAYEKIAGQLEAELTVGTVHYDEQPELIERFGVEVIPTLMLFREGVVLGSVVAPGSKAEIEEFIRRTLSERE